MNDPDPDDPASHCVARIRALAALDEPGRRDLLQLGYNLGRLAELTGAGRGPIWDRWKGPVADWDRPALECLARGLLTYRRLPDTLPSPDSSRPQQPDPDPRSRVAED